MSNQVFVVMRGRVTAFPFARVIGATYVGARDIKACLQGFADGSIRRLITNLDLATQGFELRSRDTLDFWDLTNMHPKEPQYIQMRARFLRVGRPMAVNFYGRYEQLHYPVDGEPYKLHPVKQPEGLAAEKDTAA